MLSNGGFPRNEPFSEILKIVDNHHGDETHEQYTSDMYEVAAKALGMGFCLLKSEIGAAILHRVAAESVAPQARKETYFDTINFFFEQIRAQCFPTFLTDDEMSGGDANALLFFNGNSMDGYSPRAHAKLNISKLVGL